MRSSTLGLLALSASVVDSFRDTSPFFFFSTSEILASSPQIVSAATLNQNILSQLHNCPSDAYVIVSQPSVNAADYHDRFSAPRLAQNIAGENKDIRSSMTVTDVLAALDAEEISNAVREMCGAEIIRVNASAGSFKIQRNKKPLIIKLDFPAPPAIKDRPLKLIEHDGFLASLLNSLPSFRYTVLYTTTPLSASQRSAVADADAEAENYHIDTDFQSPVVHMDLKRDFAAHQKRVSLDDRSDTYHSAPLFETYEFFGPGLFMGLLVTVLLLSILYVGVNGLASLQVTYAAFDRDMGPVVNKKQGQ